MFPDTTRCRPHYTCFRAGWITCKWSLRSCLRVDSVRIKSRYSAGFGSFSELQNCNNDWIVDRKEGFETTIGYRTRWRSIFRGFRSRSIIWLVVVSSCTWMSRVSIFPQLSEKLDIMMLRHEEKSWKAAATEQYKTGRRGRRWKLH